MNKALKARIRDLSSELEPRSTDAKPLTDPLPGIRAVLFDIYGTLVISASGDIGLAGAKDELGAFRAALDAAGLEAPEGSSPEALKNAIRGFHAQRKGAGIEFPEVDILAMWRQTVSGSESDEIDQIANPAPAEALEGLRKAPLQGNIDEKLSRLAIEYECRVNPVWPMPGLAQVLTEIRSRGLVLGIVSNAQFYTPLMLEAFLGASLQTIGFDPDCCVYSYEMLEAKPSTRIYQEALAGLKDKHAIAPGEVLYVGNDVRNDIWPADRMGCRTALFAGDARSLRMREHDSRCAGVRPDRVVTELRQITEQILIA